MMQKNLKNSPELFHKKQYRLEISPTLSLCSNCSCAIITQKSNENISTIKPLKYHVQDDIFYPCFLLRSGKDKIYKYSNEKAYNNIRRDFVKKMKTYCKKLNLNLKTFFSALDYFDHVCSSLSNFELNILNQLSDLCLILSAKLNENINKAIEVKQYLSGSSKQNFLSDELFLLKKLLNYDLIKITSYDILIDILKCGFIFNDEEFPEKKLNSVYDKIKDMLYLFSESKNWISMSPKEIAMGIIGWARDFLGLVPFSKNIRTLFLNDVEDIHNYLKCLNKIKKCFKIKETKVDNNNNNIHNNSNSIGNHSDSTRDSLSDNN